MGKPAAVSLEPCVSELVINNVSRIFPGARRRAPTRALEPTNLTIPDNDFVTIIGPSGCGKSTLLRLVAGLDQPTTGRILLNGIPVSEPGPDRGMVFQSYTLFPWLTVADNIAFGLREKGTPAHRRTAIVREWLVRIDLVSFEHHYPKQLSGGMQQRTAIARALANDPAILLLDEPFGALDNQTRALMQELLLDIWERERKTVLFVTHAIEEAIFAGVPINVTLLFSREHYLAAAEAFLRGIERRIEAGLKPNVDSVASIFVSRWDVAVAGKVPEALKNQLGIAVAKRTYKAYLERLSSTLWMRAYNAGMRPQRLLWASTGTKDPKAPDVLYVKALAAPFTVNTMPDGTLHALAEHGDLGGILPADGGDCEAVLTRFAEAGVDVHALASQLQDEGAKSFVKSWNDLMQVIGSKSTALKRAS